MKARLLQRTSVHGTTFEFGGKLSAAFFNGTKRFLGKRLLAVEKTA
jgi:hypothetical protein